MSPNQMHPNQPQANQPPTRPQPEPSQNKEETKKEQLFEGVPKAIPKKVILSWRAPSRPFKKRNRQYFTTVGLIVFLISLILFFAGQFLPIAVVVSIGFLSYVLSSVPPQEVEFKISNYGIEVADFLIYWEETGRFWFEHRMDQEVLMIETSHFPGRILLMFSPEKKEELKELLSEVLIEEKPADNFYDKASAWLQEKIPLELNN